MVPKQSFYFVTIILPPLECFGFLYRLQEALRHTGIEALFPVQVAVWNQTVGPGSCERDLCICSPTGSGKTLSYALPIVQKLSTRVVRRLRALIVLPTRDLATQVCDFAIWLQLSSLISQSLI
jgi:ATP-dependent RNA helicase DDX51/DBP6